MIDCKTIANFLTMILREWWRKFCAKALKNSFLEWEKLTSRKIFQHFLHANFFMFILLISKLVSKVLNFYNYPSKRWKSRFWGPKFQNLPGEHAYGQPWKIPSYGGQFSESPLPKTWIHPRFPFVLLKVPMKWKIEVLKNRCIWKAFKSEEE